MTIYVDRFRVAADITDTRTGRTYSSRWSHLISDDLDPTELHAFAARLGMKREWFQPGNTLGTKDGLDRVGDHYDLTDPKRRKAITLGAVEIDGHEMGEILIAKRKKAQAMATPIDQSDRSDYFGEPVTMTSGSDGVQMKGDRYILPTNDGLDGKWHPHTRVTAISNALPSTYGLGIWASDRVAWAMAQRPDLCALLASVPLTDVETIREVRAKAEVVSATDEGANLGTATHNILGRYASGEPIETLHRMFWPDIKAFQALLDEHGLTVLPGLIERVVRMRDYDIAGRLDYIMQERDGTLVVVDVKTKGDPEKVHEIATQLAPYANADEMFDSVTGRYVPMPPVRRDYALMIHIHPGSGVATIKKINIRLGLWSVEVAKNALAYSRMTHLGVPYTPPGPVKPADAAVRQLAYDRASEPLVATQQVIPYERTSEPPAHPVRQPVRPCADCGAHDGGPTGNHASTCSQRPTSTYDPTAHSAQIAAQIAAGGVVIPNGQPAAAAPAPQSTTSGPTASLVSAPNPATYGAPAGVTPPPAYQPQTVVPRAEAVLVTTGEGGIEAEAREIVAVFKNKSKAQMQAYARRYGITDLNHHKIHIAMSIATVRADRRKAGLDAEPAGDETTPAATKPRPQTLAEAGFGNPPASPPGEPVVPDIDASEQAVLADISRAKTVQDIGRIWQLWTDAHGGPESWRGNVQAAADAKVAEIQVAGPPAGGVDEPPF